MRAGLAEVPEVRVLSLFGDDAPRVGVISFVVEGWNSSHFAAALSAEYGIGVRDGLFCAHPLVRTLLGSDPQSQGECGAPEAAPGERSLNAIRVSFGAGTPDEHVERFVRRGEGAGAGRRAVELPHGGRALRAGGLSRGSPESGRSAAHAVQADGERRLQVVLGVGAERDVRVRGLDARDLADLAGDDVREVVVRPTRTMAIRSYVPVTEKTSLTESSAAIDSAISGIRSTLVLMSTIAVITAGSLPRGPRLARLTLAVRPIADPRVEEAQREAHQVGQVGDARARRRRGRAASHWRATQKGSTTQAGKRSGRKKRNGKRLVTRARGNR